MNLTISAQRVIALCREKAISYRHGYIDIAHLLVALLEVENDAISELIKEIGADPTEIKNRFEQLLKTDKGEENARKGSLPLTKKAERVLEIAKLEAKAFSKINPPIVDTIHLMLAILKRADDIRWADIGDSKVTYDSFLIVAVNHWDKNSVYDHIYPFEQENSTSSWKQWLKKAFGI